MTIIMVAIILTLMIIKIIIKIFIIDMINVVITIINYITIDTTNKWYHYSYLQSIVVTINKPWHFRCLETSEKKWSALSIVWNM